MKLKLIVLIAQSSVLTTSCTDFTNPLSSEEDYYSGINSNGSETSLTALVLAPASKKNVF